ncbi:hypothetical protein CFAEC_00175 [Corynebacterium faecale]|uniref:NAD-dependent epimerase/dehydratase family protein n=1 Tax=Corynebacterium faecale TaxID=1758466 RepID=UPI0025B451E1|nr:NAD-dependent epimerase/dehydratase family protein [Corynebacterium faecale]WJY90903.1 hypothetical protein CFAEC_00175 [Corynebacterium faecale]
MRIAVVGATGNAGTAVLRALHRHPEVEEVVGIARRLPDEEIEPYDQCEWRSIDIAAAITEAEAIEGLTDAFQGCDAVIHLAWMIQPNDRRELLERVNVEGTRRVAKAVAEAGVGHLVVASSVGVYSPDEARDALRKEGTEPPLRDETFPTEGIDSSHYSVDKAAQEDVLDQFEAEHPDVTVTRLRPGLLFQSDAASSIQRYFLGKAVPTRFLAPETMPSIPLPAGLRLQALHTDDVAEAYVAAAIAGKGGAFNVCADDVLGPEELADILTSTGKFVEIPPGIVRAALVTAHRTGVVPADVGWLDMGMQVPLMDNSKAKAELGWAPTRSAADALRELLDGLAEGRGHASPVLRPRASDDKNVNAFHQPVSVGASAGDSDATPRVPEKMSRDLLQLYMSDHLTGATAGVGRINRMANDFVDTPMFGRLGRLVDEISAERDFLERLINDLGLQQKPHRQAAAWVGERVARIKSDGRILDRSPMTMLLETELMRGAVTGKLGGWEVLLEHAETLGLDPEVFVALIEMSKDQVKILDEIHAYARPRALRGDKDIYWD